MIKVIEDGNNSEYNLKLQQQLRGSELIFGGLGETVKKRLEVLYDINPKMADKYVNTAKEKGFFQCKWCYSSIQRLV